MSVGLSGCQPRHDRVRALELGQSMPTNRGEPAKMLIGFLGRLSDYGNVQTATDHLSDLPERHALLRNRVERPAFSTALERKPINPSRVEPMHSGPAIVPSANIGGHAFLSRNIDKAGQETMISQAMDARRETDRGHAHAARREGGGCLFRRAGEKRRPEDGAGRPPS